MNYFLAFVIACGMVILYTLAAPVYVTWRWQRHSPEVRASARSRLVPAAVAAFVCLSIWAGLSFASHLLNIAAAIGALCCGVFLTMFLFELRPRRLSAPMGFIAGLLMLFLILFTLIDMVVGGTSTIEVEIGERMVCRDAANGLAGDSIEVLKRYLIVDKRILSYDEQAEENPQAPPSAWEQDLTHRCRAAFRSRTAREH